MDEGWLRLGLTAAVILLLNVPFGYWRAKSRKLSLSWFLAIHLPVAGVIGLRLLGGLPWSVGSFLLFAATFVMGQFLGGRLGSRRAAHRAGR